MDPCAASFVRSEPGRSEFLNEPELPQIPAGLEVVDAHVHLFPPRVFEALWRWFDAHAWNIRYRLRAEEVVAFMQERGVRRFCALHYAHKPGMARTLNTFVAEIARAHPGVLPFGTVFPGEPDAAEIVTDSFRDGARGIKLHCHVQGMPADDPRLDPIYAACSDAGRPVVIHAGREPSLGGYTLDTRALCGADQVDRALLRHPKLRMVVPHLGADEYDAYLALLDKHEHLYLDTTMVVADYFTSPPPAHLFPARAERMLYGTDFPNIPYAWSRELSKILAADLTEAQRGLLLSGNALSLFD